MSYVVSTGTVEFYRGRQNYSGGVPVAVCGVPTVLATEDPHLQGKPLLGSRSTACAGHGGVRGLDHHHRSASPRGSVDQFLFGATDPEEAAPVPFSLKRSRSLCTRPQPVGVAHSFRHEPIVLDKAYNQFGGNHMIGLARIYAEPGDSQ